jgi:hypothetical protein
MATLAVCKRSNAFAEAPGGPRRRGDVCRFGALSFAAVTASSGPGCISLQIEGEDQA